MNSLLDNIIKKRTYNDAIICDKWEAEARDSARIIREKWTQARNKLSGFAGSFNSIMRYPEKEETDE